MRRTTIFLFAPGQAKNHARHRAVSKVQRLGPPASQIQGGPLLSKWYAVFPLLKSVGQGMELTLKRLSFPHGSGDLAGFRSGPYYGQHSFARNLCSQSSSKCLNQRLKERAVTGLPRWQKPDDGSMVAGIPLEESNWPHGRKGGGLVRREESRRIVSRVKTS